MRLTDRLHLRANRKQALTNIADYYIGVERQRQMTPPPAPFDPMQTFPPEPPTTVATEPDPVLSASVDQLATELDREINLPPRVNDSRIAQLSAIKRRVRI